MKLKNLFLLMLVGLVSLFATDVAASPDYNDDFDKLEQLDYDYFVTTDFQINCDDFKVLIVKDISTESIFHYFKKSETDYKPIIDYESFLLATTFIQTNKKNTLYLDITYLFRFEDLKYC